MRKIHVFGALLMLAAWSGVYTPAGPSTAGSLQIGSAANAEVRWTPNPNRGSASTTMSGGRRGTPFAACALDNDRPDPAITLLVPDGGINLTTQAHPTLSWFVESEGAVDMEFSLSHPDQASAVYEKQVRSETGLVEVTLPDSVELEAGVPYRWTVFVNCEGGEYSIHARSFVERLAEGDTRTVATMSPIERATAYAAQGIWYDALNTLVSFYRQDGEMATLIEIRDLLRQAEAEVPLELSLATES